MICKNCKKAVFVKNPDIKLREVIMKLIGVGYDLKAIVRAYNRKGNRKATQVEYVARDIKDANGRLIDFNRGN